ncbi:monothiol glutaredoxin grx5 [Ascosphaera acerosa]|nr:monothiol glutaredoxin grx5 [Ascosphaera acerosa]
MPNYPFRLDDDGLLWQTFPHLRLCLPTTMEKEIFEACHSPLHLGFRRSLDRISALFTLTSPAFRTLPRGVRWLSAETRQAIDKAVASAPVVLFMKGTPEFPQCGFSRVSIQVLGLQGVDPKKFTAFNVLEDQELRSGIKEYSDWPTIPQLYVDKEFIGGVDILINMHKSGELATLLEEKGVLVEAEAEGEAESAAGDAAERK